MICSSSSTSLLHLPEEPGANVGQLLQLFQVDTLANGFVQEELTLAGRLGEAVQELSTGSV